MDGEKLPEIFLNGKKNEFTFKLPKISEANSEVTCEGALIAGEYITIPPDQWPDMINYDLRLSFDSNLLQADSSCVLTISNPKGTKELPFDVAFCTMPKKAINHPVAIIPKTAQLGVPTKIVFQLLDSKNVEFELRDIRYDDSVPIKCSSIDECRSFETHVVFTDTGSFKTQIVAVYCEENILFGTHEIEISNNIAVEGRVHSGLGYIFIRKSFEDLQSTILYNIEVN